jgi:hypothetical protein
LEGRLKPCAATKGVATSSEIFRSDQVGTEDGGTTAELPGFIDAEGFARAGTGVFASSKDNSVEYPPLIAQNASHDMSAAKRL